MTAMHLTTVRRHAPQHSLGDRLDDMARRMTATIREWHRRARGRRELAALNDHMLRDIGITRADAIHLSSKPFWKE